MNNTETMGVNPGKAEAPSGKTVYTVLKEEIVNHHILPAQHLFEHQLAERFRVSRTPVRAALQQLASEGFVELIPRKGAVVKGLSVKELNDLFQIRAALERMAAENVCGNQELVFKLEQLLAASKQARKINEVRAYTNLDEKFHHLITSSTGNAELTEIFERLNQKTYIFRLRALAMPDQMDISLKEHQEIVDKIAGNDPVKAGEKASEHVNRALKTLSVFLLR